MSLFFIILLLIFIVGIGAASVVVYRKYAGGMFTSVIIFLIGVIFGLCSIGDRLYVLDRNYAIELYTQSKPITPHQANLVLNSGKYKKEIPIVIKEVNKDGD